MDKIKKRFMILDTMIQSCTSGLCRSLIISGPPGLGKTFSLEKHLKLWNPWNDHYMFIKGTSTSAGLIKVLYENKDSNKIVIFDDCDSIFEDQVSLNLLKSVCDTTDIRKVSYKRSGNILTEDGQKIPGTFEFEGCVIFVTNIDFDVIIEKGSKLSPHLSALISRSNYIDLGMKTREDYLKRIKQVINDGMLSGEPSYIVKEVLMYLEENYKNFRELSLRTVIKLVNLMKAGGDWKSVAEVTLF